MRAETGKALPSRRRADVVEPAQLPLRASVEGTRTRAGQAAGRGEFDGVRGDGGAVDGGPGLGPRRWREYLSPSLSLRVGRLATNPGAASLPIARSKLTRGLTRLTRLFSLPPWPRTPETTTFFPTSLPWSRSGFFPPRSTRSWPEPKGASSGSSKSPTRRTTRSETARAGRWRALWASLTPLDLR